MNVLDKIMSGIWEYKYFRVAEIQECCTLVQPFSLIDKICKPVERVQRHSVSVGIGIKRRVSLQEIP